jgi:transposase
MCLTRNQIATNKLKAMGLTFDHVLAAISQTQSKKKRNKEKFEPLDKKLIAAYIMVARVMYVDNVLFPSLYSYNNRCYFWETIQNKDAHKTMYRWEKDKFFRGFEDNNRALTEEQDKHENLAMGQLREHVYTFFS